MTGNDDRAAELEAARQARLDECKARAMQFFNQGDLAGALVAFVHESGKPHGDGGEPLIDWTKGGPAVLLAVGKMRLQIIERDAREIFNIEPPYPPALAAGLGAELRDWIQGFR